MSEDLHAKLTAALAKVAEMEREHERAAKAAAYARNAETDALNKLNAAQQAASRLMKEMMSKAPANSDWRRKDPLHPG